MPRVVTYLILLAALVAGAYFSGRWAQREADMRERVEEIREAVAKARKTEQDIRADNERALNDELQRAEKRAEGAAKGKAASDKSAAAGWAAVERIRRMCRATDPAVPATGPTAAAGEATGDPIGVLGRVYAECGGKLTRLADAARAERDATLTCNAIYDAARDALAPH